MCVHVTCSGAKPQSEQESSEDRARKEKKRSGRLRACTNLHKLMDVMRGVGCLEVFECLQCVGPGIEWCAGEWWTAVQ